MKLITCEAPYIAQHECRADQGGSNTEIAERYMRFALKTQSQCRATWESIAVIKNPSAPIFAKQANIANGPQQVNNGPPPARENVITPNKLLQGPTDGERMDTGATCPTGAAHQEVETWGQVNREVGESQGPSRLRSAKAHSLCEA